MFINEAITSYMEETAEKRRQAEQLREICRKTWRPEQYTDITEKKAAWEKIKTDTETAAAELELSNCPAIVDDPATRAAEILASFDELKRKQEQLERDITQFNNMLPSTIESRHISTFRNYL